MKSLINRNKRNNIINKANELQRRSIINRDSYNIKNEIVMNQDNFSIYKVNKTLQKYINQKLRHLKSLPKTTKNESIRTKSHFHTRNVSSNKIKSKNKNNKKNEIVNISVKTKRNNKAKKGRNKNQELLLCKKEFKTNKIYSSYNNLSNIIKNKKNSNIININNNKMQSPIQTKGKLISNFYQNYSSSMSTGISLNNNNNEFYKSCSNFLDNNSFFNSIDSINKNQDNEFFPYFNKNFKINSNEDRNNTTNNYEIDSSEDNIINNKIFLKCGGNGSPITFGNSFSYTNSKRSSSTRRIVKNNDNDNIEEKDDVDISLLKNQNENLKKELKETSEQITFLKNEILKLMKNKNKNNKCNKEINRHQKDIPCWKNKKNSDKNLNFEKNNININNYHSHEIKIKTKNIHKSKSKNKNK